MFRLIFLILITWASGAFAATPITLPDGGQVGIRNGWDLLRDPGDTLTVERMSQPEIARAFVGQTSEPALGYVNGAAWLRLTVTRPASAPPMWLLELRSSLLNDVTLYVPQPDGGYQRHVAGDRKPVEQRDIAYRNPVFRLDLPAGQPVTLYLRIRSTSTMSFSMALWSPDAFISATSKESLLFGLLDAAHLVLLVSSLWLFRVTRDASFGLYGLSVVVNLLTALGAEGYIYQYLLPGFPAASNAVYLLSWLLGTPAGTLFTAHYLGLFNGRWWRPTVAFSALTIVVALAAAPLMLVVNVWWVRPLYLFWQIAVILVTMGVSLWLTARGHRHARVVVLVLLLLLGGSALRVARNVGWIPPSLLADNAGYLGMLAFMLIMNSAISSRYNAMRNAMEAAQADALRVARQAERDLEAKVALRTQALREAMEQVEASLAMEKRAQDEQRQLLATVSHELRTPLAVIDATAQNLDLDDSGSDPLTSSRYQKILRATQRLTVLINDSLHEDGFELLRRGTRIGDTRLAALLDDAATAAGALSDGHRLEIDAKDLPDAFVCDGSLTRLVLRTLADNAVKYTPGGTRIVLRGRRVPGGVELEVEDDGPGIAPADLPYVFDRFFRGRNVGRKPGTGLGLPLARRMVEMQGGTLNLVSEAGHGCRATVFLPANADRAAIAGQASISGAANV
ncbi:histidine kinase [Burkholderia lata]|uniref:sensor histidine kinase n=1 Tax=Burkholderia lata (strain ATCC 17760 / DSM 23089 / LMG 22485 / NCIMB 9086 / R18194 / 383) TaxID=482957 RepID=UPI00145321ED|nr:sensor histidine kinase [Burkholderia lata]VWC25560.1 histidine kinase [Burkholderia lata]